MKGIISIVCLLSAIISAHGFVKRIYDGLDAPEGKYLYHALLTAKMGSGTVCGGSIIDKRWILTAAHCFKEDHLSYLRVQVGTLSRTKGGKVFRVERRIVHEAFDQATLLNDIALLLIKGVIEFNDNVQPITLAKSDQSIDDNEPVEFTGFGLTEKTDFWGHILPENLQMISLKMFGYLHCKRLEPRIAETQICTVAGDGKGSCKGDSGGALVNAYGIQVGIDSHSFGPCGQVPVIYTQVSIFRDWIDAKIREN